MCILLRFSWTSLHTAMLMFEQIMNTLLKRHPAVRNVFFNDRVDFMLHFHCSRPLFKKEGPPSPFSGVAFQQGSVHRITKLLRGFQNMSKACWGLPKTAASGARLWEGLGLHQVEVCTAAASWCINAPHAKFTLSVLGLSIPGKQSLELLKLPIT